MAVKQLQSPLNVTVRARQLDPSIGAPLADLQAQVDLLMRYLRNLTSNIEGILPSLVIDGSNIKRLSIQDAQIINLDVAKLIGAFVASALIEAGTVTATLLKIKQILVEGLTLTSNSPGAGSIAWSSCTVYWGGNAYVIPGGNTSLMFVYWDAGAATFTATDAFVAQPNRFEMFTNDKGTADTAYDKLANNGVQETNLSFGLITGIQVQPVVSLGVDPTLTGTTTLLNITGVRGALLAIGAFIDVTIAGGTGAFVKLQFQTDGLALADVPLIIDAAVNTPSWDQGSLTLASNVSGGGGTAGDRLSYPAGFGFSNSLLIQLVVGSATLNFTAGHVNIYALYASKPN